MLAHAFLAVATAIEREHTPAPAGQIELTVNEFRRLFDVLRLAARAASTRSWPGRPGAEDTKPEAVSATTDTANINDHDLLLSYYQDHNGGVNRSGPDCRQSGWCSGGRHRCTAARVSSQ